MSAVAARIAHQITRHVLDLRLSSLDAAAEAAAHRILADTDIAAGLRALHTVAALDARHQPRTWGGHSRVQVCDACQTAWPCPDRQILDGPPTPAAEQVGEGPSPVVSGWLSTDELAVVTA